MLTIPHILLIFVLQFSNNEIKSPTGHNALSAIPAGLDCLCDLSGSFNTPKEAQQAYFDAAAKCKINEKPTV